MAENLIMENLMKEADKLNIVNIDVFGSDSLSPEVIDVAIKATRQLNSRLDKSIIKQNLQKVDRIVAGQRL
jgi:hypothetical protein